MMPIRDLPLDGRGPAYQQIYRAIRQAILSGRAAPGARLPATRSLARELGVSRTTVLGAYDQLLAEGYVEARAGSGTFVAQQVPDGAGLAARAATPELPAAPPRLSRFGERLVAARPRRPYVLLAERGAVRFDFVHSVPDLLSLPDAAWRRAASRRALHAPAERWDYGEPAGLPELRRGIADHLARARAIHADPEQIVVVSGVTQLLDIVARLFLDEGDGALLEEPHFPGARRAFEGAGAAIAPLPVDGEGANVLAVPPDTRARCKLAYVTPSHQYPTGAVLSLPRRLALLEWAARDNAYLIEDDYDSEFRYGGPAIESLKALDRSGRVVYVGTFSKTLFPGLRIAYAVLPEPLVGPLRDAKLLADWSSPLPAQEALAEFLASGEYERHVRRARTLYGRRRGALLDGLAHHLGEQSTYRDSRAGLHVLLALPRLPASRMRTLLGRALEREVGIYPSAGHYLRPPARAELVVGFTRIAQERIDEGLGRLAAVVGELCAEPPCA